MAVTAAPGPLGNCPLESHQVEHLVYQPNQVLPGRDATDRTGENVVEHQGRDTELGQLRTQSRLDHPVHTAAHEQDARFDVYCTDRVRKTHHPQNEPGCGAANCLLGNAPDIESR